MTTNPRISRFDFNTLRDFRGPIVVHAVENLEANIVPPPPPPPTYNSVELEAARQDGRKIGYVEGFAAGEAEAKNKSDIKAENANDLIATLSATVGEMQMRYRQLLTEEAANLSHLILSVSRKIAGDAINERSEEIVQNVLAQCLPVLFSKPKIVIELNPELFDQTIGRIETQLQTYGFEGEIQFKGNPTFGISDVTIDWGSGQVQRTTADLWTEIEALIQRVPLELTFAETLSNTTDTTGA
jgi:flagellar biosynthesis/type III secretory pathway protein FliH